MPSFFYEVSEWSASPYINHFLQPDTIIPSLASPQSWNRYSYVLNNPINASDPSGHKCVGEPEECLSSSGISRGGFTGGASGYKGSGWVKPQIVDYDDDGTKSNDGKKNNAPLSATITYPLSLGDTEGQNIQDHNGDYEYNTNVPYIRGASPGRGLIGPNPCTQGGELLCLASFFVSLVPAANQAGNSAYNFFLIFNARYEEGVGVTLTNIQYLNLYGGDAVFEYLTVNDTSVQLGGSYMPKDGSYHPVTSPGPFTSNRPITIDGRVQTLINTPNGIGEWPFPIHFEIPSGFPSQLEKPSEFINPY